MQETQTNARWKSRYAISLKKGMITSPHRRSAFKWLHTFHQNAVLNLAIGRNVVRRCLMLQSQKWHFWNNRWKLRAVTASFVCVEYCHPPAAVLVPSRSQENESIREIKKIGKCMRDKGGIDFAELRLLEGNRTRVWSPFWMCHSQTKFHAVLYKDPWSNDAMRGNLIPSIP